MKIRTGYISNSSSSSFIIATKNELDGNDLAALIVETLKVPKTSPLYDFAQNIAEILASADPATVDGFMEDGGYEDQREMFLSWPTLKKAVKKGFECIYMGSVSSESSDSAVLALVEMGFDYEDDVILIEKEASY